MNRASLALTLLLLSGCAAVESTPPENPNERLEAIRDLALFEQELDVVDLVLDLESTLDPRDTAFAGVRIVDPRSATAGEPRCVVVRDGRIAAITEACPDDVAVINGAGRFLVPGLVDAHVHQLETVASHILNVAHGVTTVRDMDGFDWLLAWRRQARENELFAPSMIVTGTILAASPMGWYADVVETPEDGRAAVRRQAAAGYDAIKVHNVLPQPIYDAVADEAGKVGLDLVGHIPHEISVAHAIAAGHRTVEHLKGYINDRNLEISDDDFVSATRGADVWLTPTLYANRLYLRGAAIESWLRSDEVRFVPELRLREWMEAATDPLKESHLAHYDKQVEVIRSLLPVTEQFLSGTDSGGGYPFMVPGLALHVELEMLEKAGLGPVGALRAATSNAASALRLEGEIGEIVPGARADLLLVRDNPLESSRALRELDGVMLRGSWIDRSELDQILDRLAAIQKRTPAVVDRPELATADWASRLRRRVRAQRDAGYVFPAHHVRFFENRLRAAGYE